MSPGPKGPCGETIRPLRTNRNAHRLRTPLLLAALLALLAPATGAAAFAQIVTNCRPTTDTAVGTFRYELELDGLEHDPPLQLFPWLAEWTVVTHYRWTSAFGCIESTWSCKLTVHDGTGSTFTFGYSDVGWFGSGHYRGLATLVNSGYCDDDGVSLEGYVAGLVRVTGHGRALDSVNA